MRHGHLVPAEESRPTAKRARKARLDHIPNQARLLRTDEDLQARPPAMVSRAARVEPEHIRPPAKQARRMGDLTDQRRNRLEIERAGQLEAADEARHQPKSFAVLLSRST